MVTHLKKKLGGNIHNTPGELWISPQYTSWSDKNLLHFSVDVCVVLSILGGVLASVVCP